MFQKIKSRNKCSQTPFLSHVSYSHEPHSHHFSHTNSIQMVPSSHSTLPSFYLFLD